MHVGHVPPSSDNYFPDCFRRYGEVSRTFVANEVVFKTIN